MREGQAGLPSGSPAEAREVASVYLEDASGLKGGHAERVFAPADDAGVAAVLRAAAAALQRLRTAGVATPQSLAASNTSFADQT